MKNENRMMDIINIILVEFAKKVNYVWEQRKVSDLLQERNEQAPMSEEYPLMAFIANQGVAPKGERYDRSALVNDEAGKKYKRTKLGDFIYSSNNLETGSIGLNKYGNASISPVYSIFKPTGKADLDFLGRRFLRKDFINEMVKWRQGVVYGQWKIHETDFLNINVALPSIDEQKKIGIFLDALDHLITLHQRKICIFIKKMPIDWEQRKVTDLGEIYIGLVTTMTEHYTDQGHLLIRNSDIKDGYFEFGENPIYLDEEFSEQNKSRMHQLGDVITVHTGDIGTSAVIGENEVNSIGFATIVTRPNQEVLDSDYFATYLNTDTHKQWAISMATGDGRSNYNLKDYTKLVVPIPQIKEQKKIAACIGNLNNLITLHHRECIILRKTKVNDWEQRKFTELYRKVNEKNTFRFGVDKIISVANMYFKEDVKKPNDEYMRTYNIMRLGDIAFEGNKSKNFSHGRFVENTIGDGIVSHVFDVFRPVMDYDLLFWKYLINNENVMGRIMTRCTKASTMMTNLVAKDFLNENILVPTIEEQHKIGTYIDKLDHLITLHQHKCDELQNLKKYMLQNMFV